MNNSMKTTFAGLVIALAFLFGGQSPAVAQTDDDDGGFVTKSAKVCIPQWVTNKINTDAKAKTISARFTLNKACTWEVTVYPRAMLLPASFTGKGSGTIRINVSQNNATRIRKGAVTIAGHLNGKLQGRVTLYVYQSASNGGKRSAGDDDPDQ